MWKMVLGPHARCARATWPVPQFCIFPKNLTLAGSNLGGGGDDGGQKIQCFLGFWGLGFHWNYLKLSIFTSFEVVLVNDW